MIYIKDITISKPVDIIVYTLKKCVVWLQNGFGLLYAIPHYTDDYGRTLLKLPSPENKMYIHSTMPITKIEIYDFNPDRRKI